MPWGSGGWGATPWGDGSGSAAPLTGFYVVSAEALTSNTVLVTLSENVIAVSPIGPGDATNVANWVLIREDTNATVLILLIEPGTDPATVIITGLGSWKRNVRYRVEAANLVSTTDDLLVDPKFAEFEALAVAPGPDATQTPGLIDIKDPVVDTAGDYVLESGIDMLKKLIIRRLTTAPGAFFHLADHDYGLGLRDKEIYRGTDLVILRTGIERQVKLEPEIAAVAADVELTSDNVLFVRLRGRLKASGQSFDISFPVSSGQGVAL